jgi:hypothetical protein
MTSPTGLDWSYQPVSDVIGGLVIVDSAAAPPLSNVTWYWMTFVVFRKCAEVIGLVRTAMALAVATLVGAPASISHDEILMPVSAARENAPFNTTVTGGAPESYQKVSFLKVEGGEIEANAARAPSFRTTAY